MEQEVLHAPLGQSSAAVHGTGSADELKMFAWDNEDV
jgi:hypothetical protein